MNLLNRKTQQSNASHRERDAPAPAIFAALALLLACTALGACSGGAAYPQFDAIRVQALIEKQVAFGPRVPGSEAWRDCRVYLKNYFDSLGYRVELQEFTHYDYLQEISVPMSNIIIRQLGAQAKSGPPILLGAHWDSRPRCEQDPDPARRLDSLPGAVDGAAGVALLMELARMFAESPPDAPVEFALFDGEDWGQEGDINQYGIGSNEFARNISREDYQFAIIADLFAHSGARLAREGVRFESAYIGTWCMPSRAMLLTGHHQFGVESMRMEGPYPGSDYDPKKCPFWPGVFRKNGYFTAQIGKWHTGVDTGYGRDWDFQIVWNRPKYTETNQNYYYDQPITYQGGETKILKRYSTDQYTDWAVDFIQGKGRDANQPWYLWLCYGAVHSPYTPADRHLKEYSGIKVPTPADVFPPRPGKPDWAQKIDFWQKGPDATPIWQDRTLTSWVRQYHQGVLAIDEGVKRLLATLKETGQRENTLIIFTSDQGFAWGQHGFRHKVAAYDSNIRSPLIISMPGRIPQGSVCPSPVGGVDLVPTIFRFAGIDLPWKMHGHDLSPLLENPKAEWPHPVLLAATGR
ncbi:MAG: sulfatase-like hydrolase/transferase, partial [Planctomycetes bacterium]|nr:sulfatase-like hydrolase/transferase [Planctomycetota bacterium]